MEKVKKRRRNIDTKGVDSEIMPPKTNVAHAKKAVKQNNVKRDNSVSDHLMLKNRFGPLSDIEIDNDDMKVPKKERIPPIVFGAKYYDSVLTLIKEHKIEQYSLKFMSIGIRLNLASSKDFSEVIKLLDQRKVYYYTHDLPASKPIKVVLKGLFLMDVNLLKKHLSDANVNSIDVKAMTLKNKRFSEQCNYLIYLEKGSTKMSDLKKIRYIDRVVVRWEYYRQSSGTTQCQRCQLFGHGARNCRLSSKCVKCGGDHITKDCDIDVDANNKKLLRCANCNGNHTANYSKCPSRIKYINLKHSVSTNRKPNAGKINQRRDQRPPSDDYSNFPPLNSRDNNRSSWANQFRNSTAEGNDNYPNSQQNDLFSAKELMTFFKELIQGIQRCRSKFEQLEVVGDLVLRYLNENGQP